MDYVSELRDFQNFIQLRMDVVLELFKLINHSSIVIKSQIIATVTLHVVSITVIIMTFSKRVTNGWESIKLNYIYEFVIIIFFQVSHFNRLVNVGG